MENKVCFQPCLRGITSFNHDIFCPHGALRVLRRQEKRNHMLGYKRGMRAGTRLSPKGLIKLSQVRAKSGTADAKNLGDLADFICVVDINSQVLGSVSSGLNMLCKGRHFCVFFNSGLNCRVVQLYVVNV